MGEVAIRSVASVAMGSPLYLLTMLGLAKALAVSAMIVIGSRD